MPGDLDIVLRLLLGALLGGIIGFERQRHGRPAGLRTHLLVCLASVLVMIISEYFSFRFSADPSYIRIDPGRIAAGAITGVGFLGAGVIIKSGVNVHGLTTAACLWVVAAIGLAVGSGFYLAALVSFAITYFALWGLRILESKISVRTFRLMTVVTAGRREDRPVLAAVSGKGLSISGMDCDIDVVKKEFTYHLTVAYMDQQMLSRTLDDLLALPSVRRVTVSGESPA